jgi:hypothetical protein
MDDRSPSMLKPTLIGGGVAGAVASLPLVGALNCLCCSLIIAGGFLAAFLYSKECRAQGAEFGARNAWVVGLVAGLFYALGAAIVGGLVQVVIPPPDPEQIIESLRQFTDLPPEAEDAIYRFAGGGNSLVKLMIGFFFNLVLAAIFSTVGGLIGGSVFKVEAAPLVPPTVGGAPPPPPPVAGP